MDLRTIERSPLYSSLKYLKGSYKIGQCHPLATTISANMRDIIRIPIRLKIATILQANRASFNRSQLNPICLLCGNGEETLDHFLLTCDRLDGIRAPLINDILNTCSALFAKNRLDGNVNLIQSQMNRLTVSAMTRHNQFIPSSSSVKKIPAE